MGVTTHSAEQCKGEVCALHNPSDHKMKDWPRTIRADRAMLVERLCSHGIGHPDPDSLRYITTHFRYADTNELVWDDGTHGCDGCCVERVTTDEQNRG